MSRKKNRSARPSPSRETAVVAAPAVASISSAAAAKVSPGHGSPKPSAANPSDRFWLEAWAVRVAHGLGSLQIAVIGLAVFALVLIIGTLVESWYSTRIAQELVYRSWWFTLLIGVLGVNIFFAAVKKGNFHKLFQSPPAGEPQGVWATLGYWWPWKKHQTGFLITHVGLLLMVAGGVLNSLFGVDSLLALIDTDQPPIQQEWGMPQTSGQAVDKDESIIRVVGPKAKTPLAYPFRPGSLPWRSDAYLERNVPLMLDALDWFADPLPRSWSADVGPGAELEVLGYYPYARREPYSPAEKGDTETFPAVKFTLTSPMAGTLPDRWLAFNINNMSDQSTGFGPAARAEILGTCPAGLLDEFRNPPSPGQLGKNGQLVLRVAGEKYRLSADKEGRPADALGTSGWKARILAYDPKMGGGPKEGPQNPGVEFELTAPDGKTSRWQVLARLPGFVIPGAGTQEQADFQAWYHGPDSRFDESGVRGLLQFITDEDGKLYYRSFNSHAGAFAFEKSGEVKDGKGSYGIWKGMNWQFEVSEYLPHAASRPHFVPENLRPGMDAEPLGLKPAIRCRLTVGMDSKEFWLWRNEAGLTRVTVGKETYQAGYNERKIDLGFEVKLLRAEHTDDPGTQQPASYTSYVQMTDEQAKLFGEDRMITMNQPLEQRGYKLFQSGEKLLDLDRRTGMPISYSVFTVSYDPGLWLKYAGSTMLALGIACMFYMKAYFFKPRGRKAPPPAADSSPA